MRVVELSSSVGSELTKSIAEFEALFDYPLGDHQRFSIEHGPDFTAFFRAIGDAKSWVVQSGDIVVAALSSALRTVRMNGRDHTIAYIGDLKIHPNFQVLGAGKTNAKTADSHAQVKSPKNAVATKAVQYLWHQITRKAECAYCVVMDGTRITPDTYTGGGKFPKFKPVATLNILRLETRTAPGSYSLAVPDPTGFSLYERLSANARCGLSDFRLRSFIEPQWFASGDRACGMLEDTRRAKRLYLDTGEELRSAHLTYFAFSDATAAREILDRSLDSAYHQNFPAMFVSLSEAQHRKLMPHLQGLDFSTSKATVYATDDICALIPINTSEI